MEMTEILKGTIEEIIFRNDENGYTIAAAEGENDIFTVVGYLPFINKGHSYEFVGTWKMHNIYGPQFEASECTEIMPQSEKGIEEFLASGAVKGIGKKTAALIVRKFGMDTLNVMEKNPERLTIVEGIGEKKAFAIGEAFKEKRIMAEVSMYDIGIIAKDSRSE